MEEEDISDDPSSCLLHRGGDELLVAASSSSSTASTTHSVLPRSLGAFDLTLIGIGASIGSGIFVLSGVALEEAGPGVVVAFMVAASASCPRLRGALDALPVLGRRVPLRSRGLRHAVRPRRGRQLALRLPYRGGEHRAAFSGYLRNLLVALAPGGSRLSDNSGATEWIERIPVAGIFSGNVVAPCLLLLLTAAPCRGAKEGATVNRVLTGTKIATIVLVVCAGSTRVDTSLWFEDGGPFPKGAPCRAVSDALRLRGLRRRGEQRRRGAGPEMTSPGGSWAASRLRPALRRGRRRARGLGQL